MSDVSAPPARSPREVASFVRRSARMTSGQRRAWDAHHQAWVLDFVRGDRTTTVVPQDRLDLITAYGRSAPLIVEIGPGMGDSLVPMAAARTDANVLGIEVYEPAVARVLGELDRAGVDNVRLLGADAVAALQILLAPGSITELWTFFPDPWPKARHHKRRLVDDRFAELAASRLAPGGLWRLATDWASYAGQMREVLDRHPAFTRTDEALPTRPVTRFERRAAVAGRAVTELAYRRT